MPDSADRPREVLDDAVADGLHAIREDCDVGFAIEASRIEKDAIELARSAATANLPRLEVSYDEVQEEAELAARCQSVFRGWMERVRTRVEDALQASAGRAAANVTSLEHEIDMLERVQSDSHRTQDELQIAEVAAHEEQAQLEVRPLLERRVVFLLIPLLILVDWVANVPVFTELLPKDPGADAAWREMASRSEAMGLFGGLYRIVARALHNVDASLLALGVIAFLVWLAHTLGESVRRLVAFDPDEAPAAAIAIRSNRRQALVPAIFSVVGLVAVLGVLWLGRDRLESTTAERLRETESRIESVIADREEARARGDLQELGRLEQQLSGLQVLREQRVERTDYALVISRMNLPILLLNLVLAISAAVAGYLALKDVVKGAPTNPRVVALHGRALELQSETVRRRDAIHRIQAAITRDLHRVGYLLGSRPLSGWEAKADRLRAVIPRFRSENARARGIDSANVTAFRSPPRIELAPTEEDGRLTPPSDLPEYRRRFERLNGRAAGLADGATRENRLREGSHAPSI